MCIDLLLKIVPDKCTFHFCWKLNTYFLTTYNRLSLLVSPFRMPLWSCMIVRGTQSSAAPGPPSRQCSVWLHLGQQASLSEHILRRSELALFSISSTLFSTLPPLPLPPFLFPFIDAPDPLRDNLQTSESGSLQSLLLETPLFLTPFMSKQTQIKTTKGTRCTACTEQRTSWALEA